MFRKRGMSHIEMILSFLLFASAVGLALYFFSPVGGNRLAESTLTYAYREIGQSVSVDLESVSVIINNSAIPGGTDIIVIDIAGLDWTNGSRVEKLDGANLSSYVKDGLVYVDSGGGWGGINFVILLLSEDFDNENDNLAGTHNPAYYEIASSNSEVVLSENKFLELVEEYKVNYIGLKEERFNLPNRVDFGLSLFFSEGDSVDTERDIPNNLDVFADKRRFKTLRTTGEREFADLIVKVW